MKNPNSSSPWDFWQPLFLRMFVKRRMTPLTPQRAARKKTFMSFCYFACTCVAFHWFLFDQLKIHKHRPDNDIKQAMEMNIDDGKIIRLENFKLKEVIDFDRDDYEHLTEKEEETKD